MKTLEVALERRRYPIHIGSGLLARAHELVAPRPRRAIIVTNAIVGSHHLQKLRGTLADNGSAVDVVFVPDGETHKSWPTLQDIVTRLLELRADRSSVLFALGGGVVGDLAGFAAAIYQRGIAFVQVPTTLLAQVDSSVGGKTGINHALGKNMVGAFWQPRAVLIDTDCLNTLPQREFHAGIAEVVKYGVIRDASFFAFLESNAEALEARDAAAIEHAIFESCRIKAQIVGGDERESGDRALLNYGHTFGHAIEAAQGYGAWLHGEAVAAGMAIAARLSQRVCDLAATDAERIWRLIATFGLPVTPPPIALPRWLELMGRDKKAIDGAIRFVLIDAIGHALLKSGVDDADLSAVLKR